MRLIEPILFPITVYPLEIFKFAGEHNIQKFDILTNYGYQTQHLSLVNKYVDRSLMESFLNIISDIPIHGYWVTEPFVDIVNKHITSKQDVYEKYYRYFLTTYILESKLYEHSIDNLIHWCDKSKDYTFKKCFKYNSLTSVKGYYNTIIIPRLWSKFQLYNVAWINKMYGLLPVSFNQDKVIKLADEYLMEGGNMFILRQEDYGRSFWELGDGYDLHMENDPWWFTKKPTPKKSKTNEINWL